MTDGRVGGEMWLRRSWAWLAVLAALAVAGFTLRREHLLGDPDSWWHIAAGRHILDTGGLPVSDVFSHTMQGAPWAMTHEWLAQILLALTYEAAGWRGLAVLTAAAAGATILILAAYLRRWIRPTQVTIACLLAFLMMLSHVLARPHVLAWPLMVLWTAELVRAAEDDRAPPVWLLAVMLVWANLHGSFVLGLGICAFLAGEVMLARWRGAKEFRVPWRWVAFGLLAGLTTLVTPHATERILAVVTYMGQNPVQMGLIGEWQSPDFQRFQPLLLWLLLFVALAALTPLRLPATRLVLILGLLTLALRHQRYVELVGLLGPLFAAGSLGRYLGRPGDAAPGPLPRRAHPALVLAVILPPAAFFALRDVAPPPRIAPVEALAAVRSARIEGPVLNSYGFGGYLIFSGVPTFIDGRADLFGDAHLESYAAATTLSDPEALPDLLAEHAIAWTLLRPGTPALALLDRLPGWRRLHADEVAVVHVREDAEARAD